MRKKKKRKNKFEYKAPKVPSIVEIKLNYLKHVSDVLNMKRKISKLTAKSFKARLQRRANIIYSCNKHNETFLMLLCKAGRADLCKVVLSYKNIAIKFII